MVKTHSICYGCVLESRSGPLGDDPMWGLHIFQGGLVNQPPTSKKHGAQCSGFGNPKITD